MKKLLLVVWIACSFAAGSQVVFCPPGAVWQTIHTHSWPNQTLETETVLYTGDQIIGTDTVKVLAHNRFFLDVNNFGTSPTYLKQKGDTVFMKNVRTQHNWQILYNYAAQPGDVWYNNLVFGSANSNKIVTYTISVISTQTVLIKGLVLKQLTVNQKHNHQSPRNNFTYGITERLGSPFIFMFGGRAASDGDYFIEPLCYTDSTFGTHQYSNKPCNYTTLLGVEDLTTGSSGILLYPNPVQNNLNIWSGIENLGTKCQYNIINAHGEIVKEGEAAFEDKTIHINTQELPGGIYSLVIRTQGLSRLSTASHRFIKTD